jgi:cell division protein FtsW
VAKHSILLLALAVITLIVSGFVMLASASYYAIDGGGEEMSMIIRQSIWLGAGLIGLSFTGAYNYQRWIDWRWPLLAVALTTLILCYVPGVGVKVNGASRWIGLDSIGFRSLRLQPSEFAKIALLIVLASWYARHESQARSFINGFAIPAGILGSVLILVALEMDLGNATIIAGCGLSTMLVAGTRLRYVGAAALIAIAAITLLISTNANRMVRVKAFLSEIPGMSAYAKLEELPPEVRRDVRESKVQQLHSAYAFGSGGVEGVGPGLGRMKMYSLPEAHTDFIFPLIGEELGLRGTLITVLCFV